MVERVPKNTTLHFFNDEDGRFKTRSRSRSRGSFLLPVGAVAVVVGSVAAWYLSGLGNENGGYTIPYDPNNPGFDVYGRPIAHPRAPTIITEMDTTMADENGEPRPPKGSPDAEFMRRVDPLKYYRTYYADVTRGYLRTVDGPLYRTLEKAGLLDQVPYAVKYGGDPLQYYRDHYPGVTRGQLCQKNPGLYHLLRARGLIDEIPFYQPYDGDAVAYYKKHYAGLTRGKLLFADHSLYEFMQKNGLLDVVPYHEAYGGNPLQYYFDNYYPNPNGEFISRGQLSKENPALYRILQRHGMLSYVPLKLK